MNMVSEDIKDMLEAEAFDLVFTNNLFIGKEPAEPANKVTIYDSPSYPPDLTLNPAERYYTSGAQILVRNQSYEEGMVLARNIMESLHGRANETWNGTYYMVITAMGEPAPLDWDGHGRPSFFINFNLQRR